MATVRALKQECSEGAPAKNCTATSLTNDSLASTARNCTALLTDEARM